jgi:hypothetical protein
MGSGDASSAIRRRVGSSFLRISSSIKASAAVKFMEMLSSFWITTPLFVTLMVNFSLNATPLEAALLDSCRGCQETA